MIKKHNHQEGFTLIELIIVMAIIAVLAGLAVTRYSSVLHDSEEKADNSNVRMLQDAVDLYAAATNTPVNEIDDLEVLKTSGYIKEIPENPTGGKTYNVVEGIVGHSKVP